MNKQLKSLLVVLLVLIAITGIIFSVPLYKKYKERDRHFAIEKSSELVHIRLHDSDGNTSDFKKQADGTWTLNDKWKPRKQTFMEFLSLLENIHVSFPVSKASHNNVIKDLSINNVKVELFTDDGKPDKVYYVGGSPPNYDGTYMIMELGGEMVEQAYVCTMPGEQDVTAYFQANPNVWRSREVFAYSADQIKKIEVRYNMYPEGSFVLDNSNPQMPTIKSLVQDAQPAGDADLTRLKEYVSYYESGIAENFLNDYLDIDTILKTTPYCTISVTDKDNKVNKVKVFNKPVSERSKGSVYNQDTHNDYDIDKYIATLNNDKDYALIQYYVFGKYFKKYRQFFPSADNDPHPITAPMHR
jgi:hypothetical protein